MNTSDRPCRVKGLVKYPSASGIWTPCTSFTKKWWDSKWLPIGGCARWDESFVFFKIAEGYGGHTQNLTLFEASNTMFLDNKVVQLNSQETTLHRIALNIALEDFESEKRRLESLGLKVNATVHEWLFVFAPCTSPTQKGICWSLSVMMQMWDREMLACTQRAP